jgi:hypothetical protein
MGPICHSDDGKSGAVPNTLWNSRSTVELLHGEISWICNSGAIFAELELSQTRLGLPHVQIEGIVEAHNFGSQTFVIR